MRVAAYICAWILATTLLPSASVAAQDRPATSEASTQPEDDTEDDTEDVDEGIDEESAPIASSENRRPGEDVVSSLEGVIRARTGGSPEPRVTNEPRLAWHPEWPRYSFDEAMLTLGLTGLLVAAELLPNATTAPNFRGMVLDDAVRSELRLEGTRDRDVARAASDVLQAVNIGIPFLFDALLLTGIGDGAWESALQMGLVAIEAYVVTLVMWRITSSLARRERPAAIGCAAGDTSDYCDDARAPQSFYSAHAANAWTGAGLSCLFHTSMRTHGNDGADALACGGAIGFATVGGLLRVLSDSEYLSDVVVGAAMGFVSGYVLPWLLHFQGGARTELSIPGTQALLPLPLVTTDLYGVQLIGTM